MAIKTVKQISKALLKKAIDRAHRKVWKVVPRRTSSKKAALERISNIAQQAKSRSLLKSKIGRPSLSSQSLKTLRSQWKKELRRLAKQELKEADIRMIKISEEEQRRVIRKGRRKILQRQRKARKWAIRASREFVVDCLKQMIDDGVLEVEVTHDEEKPEDPLPPKRQQPKTMPYVYASLHYINPGFWF